MVMFNTGALPAENSLMARYAPARWQATAYGLKFIIAFTFALVATALAGYFPARKAASVDPVDIIRSK